MTRKSCVTVHAPHIFHQIAHYQRESSFKRKYGDKNGDGEEKAEEKGDDGKDENIVKQNKPELTGQGQVITGTKGIPEG